MKLKRTREEYIVWNSVKLYIWKSILKVVGRIKFWFTDPI